jgi:hypothetical protein
MFLFHLFVAIYGAKNEKSFFFALNTPNMLLYYLSKLAFVTLCQGIEELS